MKKIFTFLFAILCAAQLSAQQKIYIHTIDSVIERYTWEVDSITFQEATPLMPVVAQAVDLGLSVKWANFNIGATQEEEPGYLVGWGDITGINRSTNLKYFPVASPEGNIIKTRYDMAAQKWGGDWRLPTADEIKELINGCTWEWTTAANGVAGYKVTSKAAGNTNSIFLPVTGMRTGTTTSEVGVAGYYWSGILDSDIDKAVAYKFSQTDTIPLAMLRYIGCALRPVSGPYVQAVKVTAAAATDITYNSANINLTLSGGISDVTSYGICFAKNPVDLDAAGGGSKKSATVIPASQTQTFTLTGLTQLSTYYYVGYALVNGNYVYGDTLQFTTPSKYPVAQIVDLGLSVKWASWNMGATSVSDYGGYFGWGDPTGELITDNVTAYGAGNTANNIGGTQYDIARVQWGGKWRLPTRAELDELEKCTWTYSSNYQGKGVQGWIVSNNGQELFFPRAGWKRADNTTHGFGFDAYYWSSELSETDPNYAYYGQLLTKNTVEPTISLKTILMSVRPIYDEAGTTYVPPVDPNPTPTDTTSTPVPPVTATAGVAVDLGLSVKWADRNVGATSATDYGKYFAWGETADKAVYDKSTYTFGTYNSAQTAITDNFTGTHITGSVNDVANKSWGGTWRMPTDTEINELIVKCTWVWTTKNGVNGFEVSSTADPTKKIFLPAGGWMSGSLLSFESRGAKYWSDELFTSQDPSRLQSMALSLTSASKYTAKAYREIGALVRPVKN